MGRRQTSSNMARDDICRGEGSLMNPERLGHPSGKTQFERTIAGSCQLARWDDASCTSQQVGRNTARHATSEHQVFGDSLALRQIFGLERRRVIVTLHQTHAVRIASRRHAGEQTCKTVESSSSSMPAAERPRPR